MDGFGRSCQWCLYIPQMRRNRSVRNGRRDVSAGAALVPRLRPASRSGPGKVSEEVDAEYARDRYRWFVEQRGSLLDGRRRGQQRLDQLLVGGAAGALTLSATFVEKLPAAQGRWPLALLAVAWLSLLSSLWLSVAGHRHSVRAFEQALENFDTAYRQGSDIPAEATATQDVDRVTAHAFKACFVGLIALALYAFVALLLRPAVPATPSAQPHVILEISTVSDKPTARPAPSPRPQPRWPDTGRTETPFRVPPPPPPPPAR
jgi:hypothetical protein